MTTTLPSLHVAKVIKKAAFPAGALDGIEDENFPGLDPLDLIIYACTLSSNLPLKLVYTVFLPTRLTKK
jgi:hypothetical protein